MEADMRWWPFRRKESKRERYLAEVVRQQADVLAQYKTQNSVLKRRVEYLETETTMLADENVTLRTQQPERCRCGKFVASDGVCSACGYGVP